MKNNMTRGIAGGLLLAAALTNTGQAAGAFDEMSRKETHPWELYAYGRTLSVDIGAVKCTGYGGGAGVGYTLTDHLSVNGEVGGGSLDAKNANASIGFVETKFSLEYNILKTRLTPVLAAGLGTLNYVTPGFTLEGITYGGGAGLRWDITDRLFAKALYRVDGVSILSVNGFAANANSEVAQGFYASFGFKF